MANQKSVNHGPVTTWSNMGPDADCEIELHNRTGAWSVQRFVWHGAEQDHVAVETLTGEKARLWIARNTDGALVS